MLTALWGYLIHLLLDNVFDNVKLFAAIHSFTIHSSIRQAKTWRS